jgi:hypothetical protein
MVDQVHKYLLIDEYIEDEVVVHTAFHVVEAETPAEAMLNRSHQLFFGKSQDKWDKRVSNAETEVAGIGIYEVTTGINELENLAARNSAQHE